MKPKSDRITFRFTTLTRPSYFIYRTFIKIHTIDLKFQDVAEAIAAFLVEGPEGLILIETGPESCRQTLVAEIQALGFSPTDICAVFVTHVHLDHSGGAGWWAKQGIPVHVHPKGAKHLIDPSRLEESARIVYGDRFDSLWGCLTAAPESHVVILTDGETAKFGGLEIRALDTPGHAFHHHAYAIDDVVFTGDSAGARLPGFDYISVTSAPPQFHLEHTLASIDRLASENFRALYLTHFGEIENPAQHLADYRDAVELNAEFVRMRLAEGMDGESLQIAYAAFNLEQAYRLQVAYPDFQRYQAVNHTDMCADGIRIFWDKN